uniref:Mitochondrial protein n=1 Tax=Nicotiana tabacum TaxID=4097 RepID=A0A1S4D6E1_TOBAC|nr:PREDICTED: uncharacterized protein LOC107826499 [Nicotiana tabacum]
MAQKTRQRKFLSSEQTNSEGPGLWSAYVKIQDVKVQETPLAPERRIEENQPNIPSSSQNEPQTSNWRHQSSHPMDNIITPLDSGVQTRSRVRNSFVFSAFFSQIEPKNIMEALKDADWITTMQHELHQFDRNNVWHLDLVLYYPSGDSFNLIGYADTDYVGYLVDRKSTSGMAHFLGSCLISWGTKKQNSVALSTAEA